MPKFTLFIEYHAENPNDQPPRKSNQEVAARDADEAVCAAEAVADFAISALAESVKISILDQRQAKTVKIVQRPLGISN
jgi:hypothetical protein